MGVADKKKGMALWIAIVYLVAACSGTGSLQAQDNKVESLIRQLSDADWQVRERAARELGELKDARVVGPLIAALFDSARSMEIYAASALGKIKDPRAVEPLITLLKAKNDGHRLFAAIALGDIGNGRAVMPLLTLLKDEKIANRGAAAEALWKIQAVNPLEESMAMKVQAAMSEAVPSLIEALEHGQDLVRNSAAEALGFFRDVRAVEPLITILKDKLSGTRGKAARSLGFLKDPRAVEPLRQQIMNDSDIFARNSAAWALRDLGPVGVPALCEAVRTGKRDVKFLAANTLYEVGGAGAEALISLTTDPDVEIRTVAVRGLQLAKDERAVAPLISLLKDKEAIVRAAAAESLQFYTDPRAIDPLITCLSDKDPGVKKSAAGAFAHLKSPAAIRPLITLLKDKDEPVQKAAEEALWFLDEVAAEALVETLKAGDSELMEKVSRLLSRSKVEPERLLPLLAHRNKKVRLEAAFVLCYKGNPAGYDTLALLLKEKDLEIKLPAARRLIDSNKENQKRVVDYAVKTRDIKLVSYFYGFFIENGVADSESMLCEALKKSGSATMAEDFINSGNIFLSMAAMDWAKKNGYRIVSKPRSDSPRWGKRR